jgi:hypothetical protein
MNSFHFDYDDANIALGVTQHGVSFLFGAAQGGIATAKHTAKEFLHNGDGYGGASAAAAVCWDKAKKHLNGGAYIMLRNTKCGSEGSR